MKRTRIVGVDIGNTQTKFSQLYPVALIQRVETKKLLHSSQSIDTILDRSIFSDLDGCIISSVVPSLNSPIVSFIKTVTTIDPYFVEAKKTKEITFPFKGHEELGADRVANIVGAIKQYGKPSLVISFGTATTFDVIDVKGVYLGGAIAPGLALSFQALTNGAAQLAETHLVQPDNAIGQTTEEQLMSGNIYGHVGLVEYLIGKMKKQYNDSLTVIATGGNLDFIIPHTALIEHADPELLFKGLEQIYSIEFS